MAHLTRRNAVVEGRLKATGEEGISIFAFTVPPRKEADKDSSQRVRDEMNPEIGYLTSAVNDLIGHIPKCAHEHGKR